jgi:hypothetical protein
VFLLALPVVVAAPVGGVPGIRHVVWQEAACELHDIMQFVTVEVGVETPWEGGVTTFGVVACASATSCAPR